MPDVPMSDVARSHRAERFSKTHHPSDHQLHQFGLGQIAGAEAVDVEHHVMQCEQCCQHLENVSADPLVNQLQKLTQQTSLLLPNELSDTNAEHEAKASNEQESDLKRLLDGHPKFQFIRMIGSGGMGAVCLVQHRLMNREVALKVIAPRLVGDSATQRRFRREIEIIAQLNHPNIVSAYDAEWLGDSLLLVTEYVPGLSMGDLLKKGPLEIATACRYFQLISSGLAHAHNNGLVHRDIKPQNLLISNAGDVKVTDFGLANYRIPPDEQDHELTESGVIVGTPDYLSPEQIREQACSHRTDLYSLGCSLYHALTGRPPFSGDSVVEKLAKHLNERPVAPNIIRPEIPSKLSRFVENLMAKDPNERVQTAENAAKILESLANQPTKQPREKSSSSSRRTRRGILSLAAIFACVMLATTVYNRSNPNEKDAKEMTSSNVNPLPSFKTNILLVVPPEPRMADIHLLTLASDKLAPQCQLHYTSCVPATKWIHQTIPIEKVQLHLFDALVFIGGEAPVASELSTNIAVRKQIKDLISEMRSSNKPISSIGSGLAVLAYLDEIRDRKVAKCSHLDSSMKRQSQAVWSETEDLVVDGTLVTTTNSETAEPLLRQLYAQIITNR